MVADGITSTKHRPVVMKEKKETTMLEWNRGRVSLPTVVSFIHIYIYIYSWFVLFPSPSSISPNSYIKCSQFYLQTKVESVYRGQFGEWVSWPSQRNKSSNGRYYYVYVYIVYYMDMYTRRLFYFFVSRCLLLNKNK